MKGMKEMRNMKIPGRKPQAMVLLMAFISLHAPHVAAVHTQVPGPLVTTAWLAGHLADPGVVIISSDEPNTFAAGHIPGARVIPHVRTIDMANHRPLPPAEVAAVLADAGATDDTRVILYGNEPMATGWLYMLFATLGHADNVSWLDGDMTLWRQENRPVATGAASPAKRGKFTPVAAADIAVDAPWVKQRLEAPGVKVLDVRTTREWDQGRLPGATLVLWQDLFVSPETRRFKSPDEIRALLTKAGVKSGDQVVTYCAVGMRASLMYFAATRLAAMQGRIYVGSMTDWQTQSGYPIVR
jgi:thiosulfate/3-mercaptopyruvate sulfurtransferase